MSKRNTSRSSRQIEADVLRSVRREAWERQDRCCKYCLAPLAFRDSTADHRVPRSKGGTNLAANIDALCAPCNTAKASMSAVAFRAAIKQPQPGMSLTVWLAWSRRRMWLATYRAMRGISRSAGMPNPTPVGVRA